MKNADNRIKELRKKEVLDYADNLSSFLSAKKKKAILEFDILRNRKEIEYISYRLERIQKHLDEKKSAIDEIEPKIAEARDRLTQVQQKKKPIEDEYNRLLDIQKNLKKKQADIQENRSRIKNLTAEIREATDDLKRMEDRNQQASNQKEKFEEEINSHKLKLGRLEEEIEVMTATRDMISGKMAESFNIEDFPSLQSHDMNVEEYVEEVNEVMNKIENDITTAKDQIDESFILEESLTLEKDSLQRKLEDLESNIVNDENKESLITEVNTLSEQKERLTHEIDINHKEIQQTEPIITERENSLEKEKEIEIDYKERLKYLNKRKQEMDEFENIELEMERLENSIQKFDIDARANKNILDIINSVKENVESINISLETAAKEYNAALNELKLILNLGASLQLE